MHKGKKRIHEQVRTELIEPQNTKNKSPKKAPVSFTLQKQQAEHGYHGQKMKKLKIKQPLNEMYSDGYCLEFTNDRLRIEADHRLSGKGKKKESNLNIGGLAKNAELNVYLDIYKSDLHYYQEYMESCQKMASGGINLKWPYYFAQD